MSIVSSSGVLVKRESTSRLPIKNSKSCSTVSSAQTKVKDFKVGTRNFANLWVGVLVADKIDRKGGKTGFGIFDTV